MNGSGLVFEPSSDANASNFITAATTTSTTDGGGDDDDDGENDSGGDDNDDEQDKHFTNENKMNEEDDDEEDTEKLQLSKAWKSFVGLSLSKTHDVTAKFAFGYTSTTTPPSSPSVKVTVELFSRARIKSQLEKMLNNSIHTSSSSSSFQTILQRCRFYRKPEYLIEKAQITNRSLKITVLTNQHQPLKEEEVEKEEEEKEKEMKKKKLLHQLFSTAIQIGSGHPVTIKKISLTYDHINPNYDNCAYHLPYLTSSIRNNYCLSKLLIGIFRITLIILLFIKNIFSIIYSFISTGIISLCSLLAWLWRRSITLNYNITVADGEIPKGKILIGRRLTVRHDFKNVSKERMLFVYRNATVVNILRGRRMVVVYDSVGEDETGEEETGEKKIIKETVKHDAVRELNSVPDNMLRGSLPI